VLPNFLIIGAPKAGTTTLFYSLDQHPDIFMCPVKEVGFFWAYGEEIPSQAHGSERLRNRVVQDLDGYQKIFAGVRREQAIGEASVRYLSHPHSPELIHQFIPDAKLIVILRQPADRAFSGFIHNLQDGVEPCEDFRQAVIQEQQGLRDDWTLGQHLQRGFYSESIMRYLQFFQREQLHISLFEDLKTDPMGLMHRLFHFLGVDSRFNPDISRRHNASGLIPNPLLRKAWARSSKLRAFLRPLLPPRQRHDLAEFVLRGAEKPAFPPDLRAELTEYYRAEIETLQNLIERDLSAWLLPIKA
jgi:hypothetical protein